MTVTEQIDRKHQEDLQRLKSFRLLDDDFLTKCFEGDTGEGFEDGSHIVYVNGAYRDESPIGKLMHDFSCTDPADMYYDVLADRVRFFKESKEGVAIMCKVIEDMRREEHEAGRREGLKTAARRMLSDSVLPLEKIAEYVGLPLEEVKKLQETQEA